MLLQAFDLSALNLHGPIYTDGMIIVKFYAKRRFN